MKTDALFYKLFRISPRSLFRLVGMRPRGRYAFESITVKTREKRFDGFLETFNQNLRKIRINNIPRSKLKTRLQKLHFCPSARRQGFAKMKFLRSFFLSVQKAGYPAKTH